MWRLKAHARLMLPDPRTLKRLAAPLLVFIFGIEDLLLTRRWVAPDPGTLQQPTTAYGYYL
jgi:hypothetical protein